MQTDYEYQPLDGTTVKKKSKLRYWIPIGLILISSIAIFSYRLVNNVDLVFVSVLIGGKIISGGFVNISWSGSDTRGVDDWIVFTTGFYPTSSNIISESWQYTYGSRYRSFLASSENGTVSVKAPSVPGSYRVFYCRNNGYNCVGTKYISVTAPQVTCRPKNNTASAIKHVITIISENHSFDSYFGRYCQAPPGSNPKCNVGRNCCEAGSTNVNGISPILLNDTSNLAFDPCHSYDCMLCGINGGKMDGYMAGGQCSNSDNRNFAMADGSKGSASQYWSLASQYALADRFFQSAPGASSQSDMYYARGAFVFKDNDHVPPSHNCQNNKQSYDDPTIANLLIDCDVSFTFYAEGYKVNPPPNECYPNYYDAGDVPFQYYPSLTNSPNQDVYFRDYEAFKRDIQQGTLPAVSYIKPLGYKTEHPGLSTISSGELFNQDVIERILTSTIYRENTLILLVPDESGGYRDSITPPPKSKVDNHPYGPRIPLLAIGNMVLKNYISHVQMEPASIIRFIESNFLGDIVPGQLQTRDAAVNNLGSLFNRTFTGFDFN
ncbi:phosphoesterase family-domain-containing protein [Globomyces pollinis-pini]|nr:phosphoesterase family-domain-containing protein [Globomyces pollinis-pini]